MYDAIAKGFRMAEGYIFAWLNSDDMYLPWATQVMERVCNTGIQWCTGIPAIYDAEGMQIVLPSAHRYLYSYAPLRRGWYGGKRLDWIQQESTFWTRELYEKVGGLDTRYRSAGDYHLWCAFAQHTPLYSVDSVMSGFRIHKGQKSQDLAAYRAEQNPQHPSSLYLRKMRWYQLYEKWTRDERLLLNLRRLPPLDN